MSAEVNVERPGRRLAGNEALLTRLAWRLGLEMSVANTVGAVMVFLFLAYVLPLPQHINGTSKHHAVVINIAAFVPYMTVSFVMGWLVSLRISRPIRQGLRGEIEITDATRSYVVRQPLRQTAVHACIWGASEIVFVPLNLPYGASAVVDIAVSIALGGVTTCAITYFASERLLRPITEAVLDGWSVPDPYVPGVKTRLLTAWALGTGVPLTSIALLVLDRGGHPLSGGGVLFLAVGALVAGAIAMLYAARSVADPVESVTQGLGQVEDGRFDVMVPVYDGSQIGKLQSGFNAMVEGLREREQLRDLFGRQVGEDVAAQALEQGVDFDGQSVHAAVLFVDVVGSTQLAATRPPAEVIQALNGFFAIVVDVVGRTGGFVNKFEGDAALCIYGVPTANADAETCALTAARQLRDELSSGSGLTAAIGVSAGTVVAGNVGAAARYEYTVIGDAVNEAARLTELAKQHPELVLASKAALDAATGQERGHWRLVGEQTLRGRTTPTGLAVPSSLS